MKKRSGFHQFLLFTIVVFLLFCLTSVLLPDAAFCAFFDPQMLWEQAGIQCPGWSPYQPTTVLQCSQTDHVSTDSWHNVTTISGPEYCEVNTDVVPVVASAIPESPPIPASATPHPMPTLNPDGTPVIFNSTCVGSGPHKQLMLVFEFPNPIVNVYTLMVDDVPYTLAPVNNRPDRLFFVGTASAGGGFPHIILETLPGRDRVLSLTDYAVPQCDFRSPNRNEEGDSDGYVPPSS